MPIWRRGKFKRTKSAGYMARGEWKPGRISANFGWNRSLVYVEGDATMSQYTDSEGKSRTSLNIVQRKSIAAGGKSVC